MTAIDVPKILGTLPSLVLTSLPFNCVMSSIPYPGGLINRGLRLSNASRDAYEEEAEDAVAAVGVSTRCGRGGGLRDAAAERDVLSVPP